MSDVNFSIDEPNERKKLATMIQEAIDIRINVDDPLFVLLFLNRESNNQLLKPAQDTIDALNQSIDGLKEGLTEAIEEATTTTIGKLADCIEDAEKTGEAVKLEVNSFLDKKMASFDTQIGDAVEKHLQKRLDKTIRWKPIGLTFAVTLLVSALTGVSYQVYARSEQQQKLVMYDMQNRALNALPASVKKIYLEEFGLQLPH